MKAKFADSSLFGLLCALFRPAFLFRPPQKGLDYIEEDHPGSQGSFVFFDKVTVISRSSLSHWKSPRFRVVFLKLGEVDVIFFHVMHCGSLYNFVSRFQK